MSKIKVLWIITGGLRRNGICVSQLEYAKRLNKDKFSLDVLAVHNNSEDMIDEYKKAGCNVITLYDRRKNLFKYMSELKTLIKKEKYDVIHTFGSSALMGIELGIAKKCGVKVRIAHSRNTTCDRKVLEKILRPNFNRSYNYALACGNDAGDWLFDDKKYVVLHNGKDLKKYSFNEKNRKIIREKYHIEDKIAFGHVGNFNNQKNHTFLIDIFYEISKKYDNAVFFLMGTGDKMDEIKEKVSQLKLNDKVFFLGSVNNVEEIIQGMDIMLFPSLFEGLPNVVIEWQAAGLPCILSDKITEECAVCDLVKFVSIEQGVDKWIDVLNTINVYNDAERKEMSSYACKMLIKNSFEIEENVSKLEKIYMNE